jgi:hypothetical protein
VRREDLPRKLKSLGAGPTTVVVIAVPEDMPIQPLGKLTGMLGTKGFRRVVIARPRSPSATTRKSAFP